MKDETIKPQAAKNSETTARPNDTIFESMMFFAPNPKDEIINFMA